MLGGGRVWCHIYISVNRMMLDRSYVGHRTMDDMAMDFSFRQDPLTGSEFFMSRMTQRYRVDRALDHTAWLVRIGE